MLTGPVLAIPGFAEKLSRALKLPVEPAVVVVDGDDEADPARLAVAAGPRRRRARLGLAAPVPRRRAAAGERPCRRTEPR